MNEELVNFTDLIQPVVLCGGNGTRLWPLSRKSLPKQFVPLADGKSLLHATFERMSVFVSERAVWSVANEEHRFHVQNAADAAGVSCITILEPVARNTTAAMAVAALNAQPDQLLLCVPSDHLIPDDVLFAKTVLTGLPAADSGALVTFGITPNGPHPGYGYIKVQQTEALVKSVVRFVEKPDRDKAASYIASGDYFWNAGIFLVRADALIEALGKFAPDILEHARSATHHQRVDGDFIRPERNAFCSCRSESIDYSVIERHDNVVMVNFDGDWSDVGGWNEVAQLTPHDAEGNRIVGAGNAVNSKFTYVYSSHRPVVAIGTENLIIVETIDAVMVAEKNFLEQVKETVRALEESGLPQATEHRFSLRPWGKYDVIDEGDRFKVKRISVKPGGKLSLQSHRYRAEHWIVVKGTARVTCEHEVFVLSENESTFIPIGAKHRLENIGPKPLEMIEVQSGSYLGEDDIERFDDSYGRVFCEGR